MNAESQALYTLLWHAYSDGWSDGFKEPGIDKYDKARIGNETRYEAKARIQAAVIIQAKAYAHDVLGSL